MANPETSLPSLLSDGYFVPVVNDAATKMPRTKLYRFEQSEALPIQFLFFLSIF